MSTKALNRLLGRSKIDPAVIIAFEEGKLEALLAESGFAPDLRVELGRIQAATFAEFASKAYRIVQAMEYGLGSQLPDPSDGLGAGSGRPNRERVA